MDRSVIFMFSGQGSQYYHMGEKLFKHHHVFRKWMLRLDSTVCKIIGESIIDDHLYNEKNTIRHGFNRTLYSSAAIFMVEYALAQVLLESGIEPDFVLGTSLGEFASAAIAGVINFEKALDFIIKQAEILESYCPKGGMIAIVHEPNLYYETALLFENSELASLNFHSHFVLSGKKDRLKFIEEFLKAKGINYQALPVSQGFHSSIIEPAASIYKNIIRKQSAQAPQTHFISCCRAGILAKFPEDYFWEVVRKPILFQKTIQELEKKQDHIYLDLGPSGTLSTFVKYNLSNDSRSESYTILSPFGQAEKRLEKVMKLFPNKHLVRKKKEDKKMITFVFPGQGSQKKGMGGVLFDDFKELTAKADAVLGYSIKELCLEDPNKRQGQTQYTQPALYVVNALSYLKRIEQDGRKPDFVAGHSLGEYNALFAAGAFDFESGLKLVKKRGELMAKVSGGGMAAVVGLSGEGVEAILKRNTLESICIANYNAPSQIVISGPREEIDKAAQIFEGAGVELYWPLNVSGAFHSQYMEEAREGFSSFLEEFEFSEPNMPVISNVEARPCKKEDIKRLLTDQLTHSVKWTESIRYLIRQGKMEFEEVGPGDVLTVLIQRIQKEAEPIVIANDKKSIEQEKEQKQVKEISRRETPPFIGPKDEKDLEQRIKQQRGEETLPRITAAFLGDDEFKKGYNVKYAYVTGGMYKGIASKELVVKMAKAGMIGYFGTGGLEIHHIEEAIQYIQEEINDGQAYGMNFLSNQMSPKTADEMVDLFLNYGVRNIEAAAFMQMTPALVRYRLKGLDRDADGTTSISNRILAKVSRPEVAEIFLSPAPERIVKKLLEENKINQEEADLSKKVPMADDLCAEADSGGHTDQGVAYALMPAMLRLRDEMKEKYQYSIKVRVGAAGGIGTPEAAAAAFILGADFILTGSINQCTVEAGTSDAVKDLLQQMNVQDTDYAPAGDMFEMGAKVQVLRRGLFFPARANRLYTLYQQYNSLDEIDEKTRKQLQEKYFRRSFEEIFEDCKVFFPPHEIKKAKQNPKQKMALIFRWYLGYATGLALNGSEEQKVDYQVPCGPALGAFNQWVRGTGLEDWRNRHVDEIAEKLMQETAELLEHRFQSFVE